MEDEKKTMEPTAMADEGDGKAGEAELMLRRDFLKGLKKWSQAVISGVVLAGLLPTPEVEAGWVNSRGSWVNGAGAGGWANRGASWINGGGSWANSGTNWVNRGGTWVNGGGGWVNGGGGGWVNSRGGGGSWVNHRGW